MPAVKRPPSPPPSFNATAHSLAKETADLLRTSKAVQDTIVAQITPATATFENTILPLVNDENERIYEQQLIEFYSKVSTDEAIRDVSNNAERDFARFTADTAVRDDLYALVAAVRDNGDPASLDPESARLLEKLLEGFEQNGLGLNKEDRARLRTLNDQLAVTKEDYVKCIMHAQDEGLCFTRDELDGIDEDVLADLEQTPDGKLRYKLDTLLHMSLMRKATRQDIRRQVYVAFARKCEANVARLDHILSLRREKARLLGFADYAECRMTENMEKSPANVRVFLEDLLAKLAPVRDELVARWREMKKNDLQKRGEPDDGKFYPWDRQYYSTMWAKSQQVATDGVKVEEYFPLQPTITRMLAIFEAVFGLRFVEVDEAERRAWAEDGFAKEPLLWHPDARLFAVWDADEHGDPSHFLGYLYTDMYARPGKYPGYADFPVRPAFTLPSGARRHTSTALICAFDRPSSTRPALLQHPYVLCLFHELGHGLHDLAAKTRYARFHGASTSGDFNEAPSQMLEQWVWRPSTLTAISGHYSTGAPLPQHAVQRLLRDRLRTERTKTLSLLEMSLEDLALNSAESVDPTAVHARFQQEVWRLDLPDEPVPAQAADISHVTVSGMYIYLTCQVYAFDMFATGFGTEPVTREQGKRYRELVIGRGSSVHEMRMLEDFLGRKPSAGAMFTVLGLTEDAHQ